MLDLLDKFVFWSEKVASTTTSRDPSFAAKSILCFRKSSCSPPAVPSLSLVNSLLEKRQVVSSANSKNSEELKV